MRVRLFKLIGAIGFAAMLGACAGAPSSPAPPAAQSVAPGAFAGRDAGGAQRTLFIADVDSNVLLYTADINQKNPPPIGEITQGVTRSVGVCVDGSGTLYVVNEGGSRPSIGEYQRGSSSPFKTISSGLYTPSSCAVDRAGDLYVGDESGGGPVVLVYAAGGVAPTKTIHIPVQGRAGAGGLVLNRKGAIFVNTFGPESSSANVFRIAHGSSKARNLNLQSLPDGSTLGIDKAGTIYWPNYDEEAMYEFAPDASSPTNVFPTNGSGVGSAIDYW